MSNWYRNLITLLENSLTETVWEIESGYMKHTHDIGGLSDYLKHMKVIPENGILLDSSQFEELLDDPEEKLRKCGDAPIYGYYINLEERGYFYADVRDADGKTIYEIKDEDEEEESTESDDDHESE